MATYASNKAVTQLLEELAKKGIVESPLGSNRTWIGKMYGWNGVPWCAQTQSVVLMILMSLHLIGGKTALAGDFRTRARKGVNGMKWISHSRDARVGDLPVWSWGRNGVADHVSRIRTIDHTGSHAVGTTHGGNENSRLTIAHRDFRTVAEGGYVLGFARPAYGTVQRRSIKKTIGGLVLAVALGSAVVQAPAAPPKAPTPVVVKHQPAKPPVVKPKPKPVVSLSHVRFGKRNGDVLKVQRNLTHRRLLAAKYDNGSYGRATARAVGKFQRAHKLAVHTHRPNALTLRTMGFAVRR